jgi:hypothetical protein
MSVSSPVYCLNCGQHPSGPLSCCRDDEDFMTGRALVMEVKRLRVALNKAELTATDSQQLNYAIALAERYEAPFSPQSNIRQVMDGFIFWLQEQQHN